MRALWTLTVANIRSYTRDRAALFWTLAFPLIFIVMFGLIFQGGGESRLNLAWVDGDGSSQSTELRAALAAASGVDLEDFAEADALAKMRIGEVDAVIVVPEGYGRELEANAGSDVPGAPAVRLASSAAWLRCPLRRALSCAPAAPPHGSTAPPTRTHAHRTVFCGARKRIVPGSCS